MLVEALHIQNLEILMVVYQDLVSNQVLAEDCEMRNLWKVSSPSSNTSSGAATSRLPTWQSRDPTCTPLSIDKVVGKEGEGVKIFIDAVLPTL